MKVNIINHYPHLQESPYSPYLERGRIVKQPKDATIYVGDVMYDKDNNSIGIVLGCIDEKYGGEVRLDSDGMQPIDNLRLATIEDFNIKDVSCQTSLKKELLNSLEVK